MLLPALSNARGFAQRAACVNNLKQLGLAFHLYNVDYKTIPQGCTGDSYSEANSFLAIKVYLNTAGVFRCPGESQRWRSVMDASSRPQYYKELAVSYTSQYRTDNYSAGDGTIYPWTIDGIVVDYGLNPIPDVSSSHIPLYWDYFGGTPPMDSTYAPYLSHRSSGSGSNVVFFDGHVEWKSYARDCWGNTSGSTAERAAWFYSNPGAFWAPWFSGRNPLFYQQWYGNCPWE